MITLGTVKNIGMNRFGGAAMSETEITMSEKENPIIHISGTLTLKNYMAACAPADCGQC